MAGQISKNPITWSIQGNLLTSDIVNPTSTTPFTSNGVVLAVQTPILINGVLLTPIKSTP